MKYYIDETPETRLNYPNMAVIVDENDKVKALVPISTSYEDALASAEEIRAGLSKVDNYTLQGLKFRLAANYRQSKDIEGLSHKVKSELIKILKERSPEQVTLIRGNRRYTGKELAYELEHETDLGLSQFVGILGLSLGLIKRNAVQRYKLVKALTGFKVKIGSNIHDTNEEPIMLIFANDEARMAVSKQLANFPEGSKNKYIMYPSSTTSREEVIRFAEEDEE